jgi:hypothetical protein
MLVTKFVGVVVIATLPADVPPEGAVKLSRKLRLVGMLLFKFPVIFIVLPFVVTLYLPVVDVAKFGSDPAVALDIVKEPMAVEMRISLIAVLDRVTV